MALVKRSKFLRARIVYSAAETIVALAPDIPADGQRMFFEASPAAENLEWLLDGCCVGRAALTPWLPQKGKHALKLLKEAEELDRIDFEVRGR